MDCDRFAEVAAELALGVLTGRERAEAVPQLDRCDACREDVRELAFTGEELLGLLPEVTPPAGFDYRMQHELGFTGHHRCQLLGRDGRVTTIGSFGLDGGYGYWGSPESMRGTTVTGARLLTADGQVLASATFGS